MDSGSELKERKLRHRNQKSQLHSEVKLWMFLLVQSFDYFSKNPQPPSCSSWNCILNFRMQHSQCVPDTADESSLELNFQIIFEVVQSKPKRKSMAFQKCFQNIKYFVSTRTVVLNFFFWTTLKPFSKGFLVVLKARVRNSYNTFSWVNSSKPSTNSSA